MVNELLQAVIKKKNLSDKMPTTLGGIEFKPAEVEEF
jgi:hypothetical protein